MIGEAAPVGTATLTITGPRPLTVELTESVVIGRDPGCGVVLDDVTVSRRHAELRRDGNLVVLEDLGSLNGTYLNRSPVQRAVLHDGDAIWIGDHRMIFRAPRPARRPADLRPLARAS
jgi:pSer/pThr/pTyr-binding forkhead associated (FHA) protein